MLIHWDDVKICINLYKHITQLIHGGKMWMEVESILGTLMLGQVHAAISVSEVETVFVFFFNGVLYSVVPVSCWLWIPWRWRSLPKKNAWLACPSKNVLLMPSAGILVYIYMSKRSEHTISLSIYLYIYIYTYICNKKYIEVTIQLLSCQAQEMGESSWPSFWWCHQPPDFLKKKCQRKLFVLKNAVVVYNSTNSLNKNQRTEQKYLIKIMTRIYVTTCIYIYNYVSIDTDVSL